MNKDEATFFNTITDAHYINARPMAISFSLHLLQKAV